MSVETRNVLLDIYSLANRGDWLMFEAMLEQVRARRPSATVCVPERTFCMDRAFYESKNVLPMVSSCGKREWLRKAALKIGALMLLRSRPVFAEEVDTVLFSPGFRFSDQFGDCPEAFIENEYSYFLRLARNGARIYFMPQAFGPFETDQSQKRIQRLGRLATHIYAREATSLTYLANVLPATDNISVCPDFTCLYRGEPCNLPFSPKSYVAIIPNRKMLVRAPAGIAEKYCEFMVQLVRELTRKNENIVFLNHEGIGDKGIIEFLNASIDNKGYVVDNVSGGACKSVITGAKLVVTSRFHGLVSALSEAAPALCTSWSHKYQELVREMGCPDACLNLRNVNGALSTVWDAFENPKRYISSEAKRADLRRCIINMWNEIFTPTEDSHRTHVSQTNKRLFYISPHAWRKLTGR